MIRFLFQVIRFAQAVPKYTSDDQRALEAIPEQFHGELKSRSKLMVRYSVVGAFLVAFVAPCIAVGFACLILDLEWNDAMGRLLMLIVLFPVTVFFGVFAGVSFGIVRAPDWYLESPFGAKWIELSGAGSVKSAKTVALIVVVVAFIYTGLITKLVMIMAPFK